MKGLQAKRKEGMRMIRQWIQHRILPVVLAVLCVGMLGTLSLGEHVYAAEETDWLYTINDQQEVQITGYADSSAAELTIPAQIEGMPVTALAEHAFEGYENLTQVTLPDTLEQIGVCAFAYCSSLLEIQLPDSVTEIGDSAFYQCDSLEEIVFSAQLLRIGSYAFYRCTNLTQADLPEGLAEIGDYAFAQCVGLQQIALPDSLTSLGADAFLDTDWESQQQGNASEWVICGDGILLSYLGKDNNVSVPDGVKVIAGGAFSQNESIRLLELPSTLLAISDHAFSDNCNLY